MKWISAAFVALLWLGCANPAFAIIADGGTGPLNSSADLDRLHTALRETLRKAQEPNLDKAAIAAALRDILKDPNFPALSEPERHIARLLAGIIAYDDGDYAGAREQLRISSEMPQAEELDWSTRFSDSYQLGDSADAALALTRIARLWPAKLADYTDVAISHVVGEAQKLPPGTGLLSDLLEALRAAGWQPKSPFASTDELWLTLTVIRLEKNDLSGAQDVARDIRDPILLLQMRADKRFDAIVAADPKRFDIMQAFAVALADTQAKCAAAPDKLEGVNAAATLLLRMKRPQEVLDLIDGALARLKANAGAYSDAGEQTGWMKDQRADALFALGRGDEALAAMAEAATHPEGGGVNVSQSINLAEAYANYDRPKDALSAVAALQLSNASEYGRMALEDARGCPLFELGDSAALVPILAYMKAHVRDAPQIYLGTMICVGDLDSAAAEVIAELDDPAQRLAMLYNLQDYAPNPHDTKREAAGHAAWLAVRARPDVAAAIARVGRIESYDLKNPTF